MQDRSVKRPEGGEGAEARKKVNEASKEMHRREETCTLQRAEKPDGGDEGEKGTHAKHTKSKRSEYANERTTKLHQARHSCRGAAR